MISHNCQTNSQDFKKHHWGWCCVLFGLCKVTHFTVKYVDLRTDCFSEDRTPVYDMRESHLEFFHDKNFFEPLTAELLIGDMRANLSLVPSLSHNASRMHSHLNILQLTGDSHAEIPGN